MKKRLLFMFISLTMFLVMCGFRDNEAKVFDDGNLLTEDEENKLQELCIKTAKETELDIVVVTTADLGYKSAMAYADDFYDQGKYGYEFEYGSGILFLIYDYPNSTDGEVYISTAGLGILYIDDYDVEDILDAGWDDFAYEYDYYECFEKMIKKSTDIVKDYEHLKYTDEVLDDWYAGEYDDYEVFIADYDEVGKEPNLFGSIVMNAGVALVAAGISVLVMNGSYKNKMTVTGGTYFRDNSFKMHSNYDNFIRTDVSRVRIESSSSGGGGGRSGGSSHRSSGGRSHGGGGRRR